MSRGPPPCQEPDCLEESTAETGWTYCGSHSGDRDDHDPQSDVDQYDAQ